MKMQEFGFVMPNPEAIAQNPTEPVPEIMVDIEFTFWIKGEETKLSLNSLKLTEPGQFKLEALSDYPDITPLAAMKSPKKQGPTRLSLYLDEAAFADETWMYKLETKEN